MREPEASAALSPPRMPAHAIIPEKRSDPRVDDDRRKAPRYPAKHDRANLGWYHGESYQTLPGRLEDVSSGGASLVLDDATWEGGDVWLCLSGGVRTEWVRAEVVGASQVEGSAQRIRLRFQESCPFDFFKTAAWGDPNSPTARPEPRDATETITDNDAVHPVGAVSDVVDADDCGELRVAVTMFQSGRSALEPRTGRANDDERDNRAVLIPRAYLAALQLVGALLVGAAIVIKLAGVWRLDALLGLNKPGS